MRIFILFYLLLASFPIFSNSGGYENLSELLESNKGFFRKATDEELINSANDIELTLNQYNNFMENFYVDDNDTVKATLINLFSPISFGSYSQGDKRIGTNLVVTETVSILATIGSIIYTMQLPTEEDGTIVERWDAYTAILISYAGLWTYIGSKLFSYFRPHVYGKRYHKVSENIVSNSSINSIPLGNMNSSDKEILFGLE